MKVYVLFMCFLSASHAADEFVYNLDKEVIENLKQELESGGVGSITAIINEYADKVLANLGMLMTEDGLDPLPLPVLDQKFLGEEIKLDNGVMNGLHTIKRNGDVIVTYEHTTKQLSVTVPTQFDTIGFDYDYHVTILFITYSGGVEGKITNFNMNFVFGIDFNTYHVSLQASKITNSGHIDVTFSGHILDIVLNILSEFATTILHPFIVGFIQLTFDGIINNVVDNINKIIDDFFNGNSTTVAYHLLNELTLH